MLKTLAQQGIEVPPSAVECRSRVMVVQDVVLGFAGIVVVVVAALQLEEDHRTREMRVSAVGFKPKGARNKREDGLGKKRERSNKRGTYEVVVRSVRATLVIADDIATDLLVVVVVGVQTSYDHTSFCALGRQARARLW